MKNVLTAIYDKFPATIGGISKADAILEKSWDMDGFSAANPSVRSNGYNGDITSRVNLPSFYEWQEGLDNGSSTYTIRYTTEPLSINSVGSLWCRAQYSPKDSFPANRTCVGQNIYSGFNGPWLRSAHSGGTDYVWSVYGDPSSSLNGDYAYGARGVLPAIWLAGAVCTSSAGGTYNSPYSLEACPLPPAAGLAITTVNGSAGAGVTLTGTAQAVDNNQSMTVWADACNSTGQCVRKTYSGFNVASSGIAQNWTLTWTAAELPAGTYNGTVWVGLTAGSDNLSAQSGTINFTISAKVRTMRMTVIKSKAFSLNIGPVGDFDITLGTNNGVTAANSSNNLVLSSASGLASSTTATFGNSKFEITVVEAPQITVSNVSFE
jgi:hypothetical protein